MLRQYSPVEDKRKIMKAKIFKGAATALVTPMKPDGSISYDTLSGLIDYQLKHHADAVVIGGTTG